jgi:hypothetical protein
MTKKASVWQRERTINLAYIALGLIIMLAPVVIWQLGIEIGVSGAITGIITGAIVSLMGIRGVLLKGQPKSDERTRKISGYASSWSWLVALCVVSCLFLGEYFGMFSVNASQALGLVLTSMLVTIVLFNAYYRARGDVE